MKHCVQEPVQTVLIRLASEQIARDALFAKEQRLRDEKHAAEITKLHTEIASRPSISNCTFNLSLFLNDTCKGAQTIEQFFNEIPLNLTSESMSKVILDNLSRCAVEDRPIHCTDVKRCKLAVKHGENLWEQDHSKVDPLITKSVNALRQRFIRHVTGVWCEEHADYMSNETLQTEWTNLLTMICSDLDAKFMTHVAKATPIPK